MSTPAAYIRNRVYTVATAGEDHVWDMRLAVAVRLASGVRRRREEKESGQRGGQVQHEIERVGGEQQRDE